MTLDFSTITQGGMRILNNLTDLDSRTSSPYIEPKLDTADTAEKNFDVRYSAAEVFDKMKRVVSEPKRV